MEREAGGRSAAHGPADADLCRLNPLPNLVLSPGAKDPAADFAASLAEPAHAPWTVPLAQLLQEVLRRSESPTAEGS